MNRKVIAPSGPSPLNFSWTHNQRDSQFVWGAIFGYNLLKLLGGLGWEHWLNVLLKDSGRAKCDGLSRFEWGGAQVG
jgi:hypothetical protein